MTPLGYLRTILATISTAGMSLYFRPSCATHSGYFATNFVLKTSGVLLGSTGFGFCGRNVFCSCVIIGAGGTTTGFVACGSTPFFKDSTAHCIPQENDDGSS